MIAGVKIAKMLQFITDSGAKRSNIIRLVRLGNRKHFIGYLIGPKDITVTWPYLFTPVDILDNIQILFLVYMAFCLTSCGLFASLPAASAWLSPS